MRCAAPLPLAPLLRDLRSGALSPLEHVEAALERIALVEAEVQALLPEAGRAERLRAEASALLERWPLPAARPPLFGALLGVKDLFSARAFETRAGSRLPPELFAMPEASSVAALKAAGALILGKTVSTEFAYFAPGPTRNPQDTERTPGGSSSGSAAAVASGYCPFALGTQTIGSISRPAAFCGISGWKPSYGRVAADGIVPFAPSLDHPGLLAADAEGLALAAPLLASAWRRGAFAEALARFRAAPPALAVPIGPYLQQALPETLERFEAELGRLASLGFRVLRVPAFADIADINARHRRIAAAEFAATHRAWYAGNAALYAPESRELVERGLAIEPEALAADRAGLASLRLDLERALAAAGADCWISPAAPGPAPRGLSSTGDPVMNLPWTHAGLPTLVLPGHERLEGLPLGLQLAAPFGDDEVLLGLGQVVEEGLRVL